MSDTDKTACKICGKKEHILIEHIVRQHSMQPTEYIDKHPGAPLWSNYGYSVIQRKNKSRSVKMVPRTRREVPLKSLFPSFGKSRGYEVTGDAPIFDTPGPRTPPLDPNYIFPEEQTMDILSLIEKPARNNIYIKGWSGTGKTTLLFNLAAQYNAEVMEWNADAYQQRATLIGQWKVKNGETVFEYGILPLAMMNGWWLIINEIDTIDPHTMNILKPVLEDPPRLTILENGSEVIEAHPDFRRFATGNTWARGDDTGMFVNTMVQSDADSRRWHGFILLEYMDADAEKQMMKNYLPTLKDEEISNFVVVANKVRESFKAGKIDKTFSPAELINWGENYLYLNKGVHHAARISFLNKLAPDVTSAIDEIIIAVFGAETEMP